MIGKTLNNRYKVEEQLGQGGMGSVFRALDVALNQRVAIKVLPFEMTVSAETEKRFEREFLALTNLSHPNIITVFEYGKSGSIIFFVMEYLEGHDLRWIMRSQPRKVEDFVSIVKIFLDTCRALHYMHSNGIIHRDLKPQNIFLQKNGELKVMDFGLAKFQGASVDITQDGAVLGTATYMAPEQASGHPCDERSDIYAMGAILYHVLCKEPPFSGVNPMEVLKKHMYEPFQKPAYHNPYIPKRLVHILEKCLEKVPDKRYQSAMELSSDLQTTLRMLEETKVLKLGLMKRFVHRMKHYFSVV